VQESFPGEIHGIMELEITYRRKRLSFPGEIH
jgi:hypothetical protein